MPSSNNLIEELHQRWQQHLAPFTPSPDAAANTWNELVDAYTGPDRHYHNLSHIGQVLDVVKDFDASANHPVALALAAWFHDAVYDTHASDNEERTPTWRPNDSSVWVCRRFCGTRLAGSFC